MGEPVAIDLARFIRPGDRVVIGQGTAEALTLTEALVAQRAAIGPVELFLGALFSSTFRPETSDGLTFTGYGAIGGTARLAKAGLFDPLPAAYSRLEAFFDDGTLSADVVLLQIAPGMDGGPPSLGNCHDYTAAAARRARVVIAEVNDAAPWTHGGEIGPDIRIDHMIRTSRPPAPAPASRPGAVEEAIARHIAALVPDGATLQMGIGSIPEAVLPALAGHRDLGVHSGLMGDAAVDLIEKGAITNALKDEDRGVSVAGCLFGSDRLIRFAHRNRAVRIAPPSVTHGAAVLAGLPRFTAINSAVEVDLFGAVNAEMAGGTYLGAVGGQPDFVRGALNAQGGRSIIALPATAKDGAVSRIVPALSGPVTTPRSDADVVVTEFGVADLRGCSLSERARRMAAIAAPAFREALEHAARQAG
ncbi:acetyl-CoA hydrolase/transferase family protein [Phreatobacter sp.]|uniref:acetyl-CoA hydrolase/transferase family protein n=1 Tax=Phreatobacter sp. TaxID=1966341 RepID=UPI003F70AFD7